MRSCSTMPQLISRRGNVQPFADSSEAQPRPSALRPPFTIDPSEQ